MPGKPSPAGDVWPRPERSVPSAAGGVTGPGHRQERGWIGHNPRNLHPRSQPAGRLPWPNADTNHLLWHRSRASSTIAPPPNPDPETTARWGPLVPHTGPSQRQTESNRPNSDPLSGGQRGPRTYPAWGTMRLPSLWQASAYPPPPPCRPPLYLPLTRPGRSADQDPHPPARTRGAAATP